jgi:DNA-binding IclR family transcriptional regulator
MVNVQPDVNPAGRYTVTETCKLLGIHRATLHRATISLRIKCGFRKDNHRKYYTGLAIIKFWRSA